MPNYNSGRGGRGGGRSGGRNSGRNSSGGGRNSNTHNNNSNKNGNSNNNDGPSADARFRPCREYTTTGKCSRQGNCTFGHIVTRHAEINATTTIKHSNNNNNSNYRNNNSNNNSNRYNSHNNTSVGVVSGIAVWEQANNVPLKLFSGSDDGHWRLWNTAGGNFVKEFEHDMKGKVHTVEVLGNYLVVGFLGTHVSLPHGTVGMVHVWNLQQPSHPPLELHQCRPYTPYAHSQQVTAFYAHNTTIYTGSADATIHSWNFDATTESFTLHKSYLGHVGEITGILVVTPQNVLWSSSTDHSIRTWNTSTGVCQFCITSQTNQGHSQAVTQLLLYMDEYVLSSSLDGTVKAWKATSGECMATIPHGTGITCMALLPLSSKHPLLLVGCETGKIMIRSVLQTPNTPAFTLLASLSSRYTCGHDRPLRTIVAGPSQTFYSGADDGKLIVWQITNDLGL